MSDGKPISTERGPAGVSIRMIADGIGFLDFTDLGHQEGGPHYWALDLNGQTYWYDGLRTPAINGSGESAFPIYFQEYPGNAGPVGKVMAMDLDVALDTFMAPSNVVILKTFISFTNSLNDAMHYQNGIVLMLSPPAQLRTWGDGITYITPLSDEANKIEYTFSPGANIQINSFEKKTVNQKQVTIIDMTFLGAVSDIPALTKPA